MLLKTAKATHEALARADREEEAAYTAFAFGPTLFSPGTPQEAAWAENRRCFLAAKATLVAAKAADEAAWSAVVAAA